MTTKRLDNPSETADAKRFDMSREQAETIITAFDLGLLHANEKRAMARLAFNVNAEPVDRSDEDPERWDGMS
jgi:hypothetical protein